jgi:site-specific recombinase XerD
LKALLFSALTAEVVYTFLARQEALAPATYNRCLVALRSFIRWLRVQGWQIEDVLAQAARKPEGARTPRALDTQRVEVVLRQITNPSDEVQHT